MAEIREYGEIEDLEVSSRPFSLESLAYGSISDDPSWTDIPVPLDSGFPRFVVLKNNEEKVRVISVLTGTGYCEFVALRRNGEMFQVGIAECIAPEGYVEFMFSQRDVLTLDDSHGGNFPI